MPEYLAPGVYVEEVSFRSKSIEGVSTSTTGFVGPTRSGPITGEPELITSFNQFERIYGGLDPLEYYAAENITAAPTVINNYLAHAVRAFFENGGARLYVARAFRSLGEADETAEPPAGIAGDGIARSPVPAPSQAIVDSGQAATAGVAAASSASATAAVGAAQAQAAALIAIQTALAHIRAALPALPADIDPSESAANIIAAVDAVITPLPDGTPEEAAAKAAAEAARDEAQSVIEAAVDVRDDAETIAADATTAQANASGAIAAGNIAGDAAAVPPLANAETAATASASAANTQAAAAQGAVTAVNDARDDLASAQTDLENAANPFTEASDLVTAAQAVNAAATAAVNAANNSVAPVTNAARDARVGLRAASANAFATFRARFPGEAGNMKVTVTARRGDNVLIRGTAPALAQTRDNDLVYVSSAGPIGLFIAEQTGSGWTLTDGTSTVALSSLTGANDTVSVVQFNVIVEPPGKFAQPLVWTELTVDAGRLQDGIAHVFAAEISNRARELETPLVIEVPAATSAVELAQALTGAPGLVELAGEAAATTTVFLLAGGNDGVRPDAEAYRGTETGLVKNGLRAFEDLEDISILAAPGVTFDAGPGSAYEADAQTVVQTLIAHCRKMRYRVAVLDSPNDHSLGMVRQYRAPLDTTYAALYYPWVRILDPVSRELIHVPPSGFMCGIYARNDVAVGVHKAPANEVLLGAIGLETMLNKAQQDVLNPLGINCIRYFEGRGIRVWGARTISSDPEWKYLNIRRYFVFLEHSIDRSTQWAVFEPNGPRLWNNVASAVSDFLFNEWRSGHLAGNTPKEAFFVRCDRSTMTQNDLDNGRMICLIGVAPLYPAEFVIFRIGQWTADHRG